MRKYDLNQVKKHIIQAVKKITSWKDLDFDEEGRIIVMSDIFIHSDFSCYDEPEELTDTVAEDNEPVVEETITFEQLAKLEAELEADIEAANNEDTLNNTPNSTQEELVA